MASQLPPSTSLLTSPTDFRGIPISQLIAALSAPSTTGPSAQYGTPVMHSTSASFQKGPDPRNRRKAGGESEAARSSRLIRERRARQAARAEAAKTEVEAAKNTGTIMRTIGGMTGGTVGTKPAAPAKNEGLMGNESSKGLMSIRPPRETSYDAVESARLGARTMGPPSSVYRAPEAAPISRTFDDPTLRPEVAAAYARVGTPKKNAARRAAERAANQEREAANVARRQAEDAQMAALNRGVAEAQGAVSASDSRLNALRQAERDQEIETLRRLPSGMFGNLSLADLERAYLNSPQVLGRVAADSAAGVGDFFNDFYGGLKYIMPSIFGNPD